MIIPSARFVFFLLKKWFTAATQMSLLHIRPDGSSWSSETSFQSYDIMESLVYRQSTIPFAFEFF